MPDTPNHDLLLAVGRLQATVDMLLKDHHKEAESAAESRARVHERLDEHADRIARVAENVALQAQTVAQVGSSVTAVETKLDVHVARIAPTVAEWKRMKLLGTGIVGLLAVGGVTVGATVSWVGEAIRNGLRNWLG